MIARTRLTRTHLARALDALWLLALAIYVLGGIDQTPLHGDESTLVFMSRDYYYLVQEHDLQEVLYDPDRPIQEWEEQQLRLLNGTTGKMAMGLAWDLAGFTVDDLNQQWDWGFSDPSGTWTQWQWNYAQGHVPQAGLLHATRLSSALLTVISIWAVFAIAWLVAREAQPMLARPAAWLAALIYTTHPNVLLNGRRAMMEGSLAAFATLTVLAAIMVWRTHADPNARPRTRWAWVIALGVLGGSAISSKHTAIITVAAVFVELLVGPPGIKAITRANVQRLAAAGGLVIVTFLLWNPGWWTFNPEIPDKIFEWRSSLLNFQKDEGLLIGTTYTNPVERARGLVDNLFWDGPHYAEVPQWINWMRADIDAYEASGWAGRLGGPVWGTLGLIALAVGLGRLIVATHKNGAVALAWMWLGATAIGLYSATPLDWARYYLPLQAPVAIFAGVGAAWIGYRIVQRVRGANPPQSTPTA